nr:DUF362 domain-containing protein [Desulfobulbaceae bacterium]
MKTCTNVALTRCLNYEQEALKDHIDELCGALGFSLCSGDRVLLKPNLVSGAGHQGEAITHPGFVAAVAAWCLDQGARVSVGDSPAFGSALSVMEKFGYTEALKGMPVALINFRKKKRVETETGFRPVIAGEIYEHEYLINLPKVKAHNQLRLTLAVKNYFGVVLSWRKAVAHMQHGDKHFVKLVVDLLDVVPEGISIADGIVAMHKRGPVGGEPFELGVIGASRNPVALETAIMQILAVDPEASPVWLECRLREKVGCNISSLVFPLLKPSALTVQGFQVPEMLSPVRFQVQSFLFNSIRRLF